MSLQGNEEYFLESEYNISEKFIIDLYSTLDSHSTNEQSGWVKGSLKNCNNIESWSNMSGSLESYTSSNLP
jgi:hypothetical protein